MTVDLFDELELKRLMLDQVSRYATLWHGEALTRSDIDWRLRDDLVFRAHAALENHVGERLPVQAKLEKRIPIGGGLGGGSSNAAAMLLGLNDLFELGLSTDELATIGAAIGSDVPFLVYGGSAIVSGLGERIDRHNHVPTLDAVIAFPAASCATGAVYRGYDEAASDIDRARVESLVPGIAQRVPVEGLFNDLARPAMRLAPVVADAVERLTALAERPAYVTGSGSSIFVVCDDDRHARALAGACIERIGIPAVAVRSVGREAD